MNPTTLLLLLFKAVVNNPFEDQEEEWAWHYYSNGSLILSFKRHNLWIITHALENPKIELEKNSEQYFTTVLFPPKRIY